MSSSTRYRHFICCYIGLSTVVKSREQLWPRQGWCGEEVRPLHVYEQKAMNASHKYNRLKRSCILRLRVTLIFFLLCYFRPYINSTLGNLRLNIKQMATSGKWHSVTQTCFFQSNFYIFSVMWVRRYGTLKLMFSRPKLFSSVDDSTLAPFKHIQQERLIISVFHLLMEVDTDARKLPFFFTERIK